jgi:glutamyl-tRNA reductase
VFLYCVDDLAQMVREGMDARESSVVQAEAIIESQVDSFLHWMRARERVPLIRQLRDRGEAARQAELDRAMRQLARGDDPRAVLEALSHGITNKLLHAPTQALNQPVPAPGTGDPEARELERLIARLYHLSGDKA